MSGDRFYITTPIYYVNDEPHVGHAYTTILGDVLARYHRLLGDDTFFLTGLDEHGQKVQQAAEARGVSPKQHCDEMAERFKALWEQLEISNDDFIRTTEPRHQIVVQALLQRLYDRGEVYKDTYEGWYCVPDERFWTEKDLIGGNCPECGRPTVKLSEENYFFRMSAHQDWLVEYITTHRDFIRPETRRNEILGFLRQPLGDLCISRPKARLSWGIPLLFDPDYVTYVWFDALTNYISAVGALSDEARFRTWWPAYHLIGKDILTTHAVYWPTMLKAAGLEPSRGILAHGWWLMEEEKMSKSLGNVVRPLDLIARYGVDAFRYFLMRDMTLGQDSQFSEGALVGRLNSDLANDFGNLLSRIVHMIGRYCEGVLPEPGPEQSVDRALREQALETCQKVHREIQVFRLHQAIEDTLELIRHTNRYLEETAPWRLAKEGQGERLQTVLYQAAEALRIAGALLGPVIPGKAAQIRAQLGLSTDQPIMWEQIAAWGVLKPGTRVPGGPPLFPRIQVGQPEPSVRPPEKKENWIRLDDFQKLDLRVAVIEGAEPVPKAHKLLKLQVDIGGEKRQLVAGIAQEYDIETLVGKRIIVIANLEPTTIRGVRSDGMLLAADDGTTLSLLTPDRAIASGAKVR